MYYLPTSFARSLGKQIEIVALIEIRSVFKDLDTTSNWPWEAAFFRTCSRPWCRAGPGVVLPFVASAGGSNRGARPGAFRGLQNGPGRPPLRGVGGVERVLLGAWVLEIVTTPDHLHSDLNSIFYNEFFTASILVDVLLLVCVPILRRLWPRAAKLGVCGGHHPAPARPGIEPWHALAYECTAAGLAVVMVLLQRGLLLRGRE